MKSPQSDQFYYKKIESDDIDFFTKFLKDPVLTKYLPLKRPYTSSEIDRYVSGRIDHWKKYHFGVFILVLKSTCQKAAYCGLEYVGDTEFIDIRYGVLADHTGKGMIREAARGMIEYGFHVLNLSTIYGAAIPHNRASIAILEKSGMKPDNRVSFYGDIVDYYSISKEDIKTATKAP